MYKKLIKLLDRHKCVLYNANKTRSQKCTEIKKEGEHNMENMMKMYVTADEAAQILGVSRGYAYKIIRGLNNELKEKGYRVISGKVPTKYFEEKFYGMAVG
mgnify:CR=1 FL=1